MFRLDGRIAFVSGGRGHLGQAMTRALADAGAHVLVNGREAQALNAFAEDLRSQGLSVEAVPFDAHDVSKIRGFFGGLKRLDVLVNNIGFLEAKAFGELQPADFAATYAATVTAAFESVRAALPALQQAVSASGDASVINVSSMYGRVSPDARLYDTPGQQSPFQYGPAKAGLEQLTRRRTGPEEGPRQCPGARPIPAAGQNAARPGRAAGRAHHAGAHRGRDRNRRAPPVPRGTGFFFHDGGQPGGGRRLDSLVSPTGLG
jgi:NAD(P)-dependent dehydrogenase (short-subunit alcohol dehydrogenase family)